MKMVLVILLVFQFSLVCLTFQSLFKVRKLFNDRYAKNMTIATSSISSFVICLTIVLLLGSSNLTIISTISLGMIIGIVFGALYKMQSLLLGFWNGWLGGLMGSMFGAVILNPELCSLPNQGARAILENIYIFSIAGTLILLVTLALVLYSLRV